MLESGFKNYAGVFTLPDTDTDTETDKVQHYSMALLSRCSVNTSTQFHTTHFLSVSVSVSVSGSVNTPLVSIKDFYWSIACKYIAIQTAFLSVSTILSFRVKERTLG